MSIDHAPQTDDLPPPKAFQDLLVVTVPLSLAMLANAMLLLTVPLKALALAISPSMIGPAQNQPRAMARNGSCFAPTAACSCPWPWRASRCLS